MMPSICSRTSICCCIRSSLSFSSSSSSSSTTLPPHSSTLSAIYIPPSLSQLMKIIATPKKDRSLIAKKDFSAGEQILEVPPITAHVFTPPAQKGLCMNCYRPLSACDSNPCFTNITNHPHSTVYSSLIQEPTLKIPVYENERFPTLAFKLALRVLFEDGSDAKTSPCQTSISHLCHAKITKSHQQQTALWAEQHESVLLAFKDNGLPHEWMTYKFFIYVLSRLHLNAFTFRTDDPSVSGVNSDDHLSLKGSALYALPSLINHSCLPNGLVSWKNNNGACLTIFAGDKGIKKHDEITISYDHDYDGGGEVRQKVRHERLFDNYGFRCDCKLCKAMEEVGPKKVSIIRPKKQKKKKI